MKRKELNVGCTYKRGLITSVQKCSNIFVVFLENCYLVLIKQKCENFCFICQIRYVQCQV